MSRRSDGNQGVSTELLRRVIAFLTALSLSDRDLRKHRVDNITIKEAELAINHPSDLLKLLDMIFWAMRKLIHCKIPIFN